MTVTWVLMARTVASQIMDDSLHHTSSMGNQDSAMKLVFQLLMDLLCGLTTHFLVVNGWTSNFFQLSAILPRWWRACWSRRLANIKNPAENLKIQGRVHSCHETVNGCFKSFAILENRYHHDLKTHGYVFCAVAVLTQLSIENGESRL